MSIKIYHNPRCSKSRQTLALLEENGIVPEIILYLEDAPSAQTLKTILSALNMAPRELMRKGEAVYNQLDLASETSDTALVKAMVDNPVLIERPIVVNDKRTPAKGRIGRPPENVLDII